MENRGLNFRRLGLALGLLLVISAAVAVAVMWPKPPRQVILLSSGDRLEFAGVTYGTNVVPPAWMTRLVAQLPKPLAQFVRDHTGGRLPQFGGPGWTFDQPQLVVWFRVLGNRAPGTGPTLQFSPMLADQAGTEAGVWRGYGNGSDWFYVVFPVAPRRSHLIQCVLYPGPGNSGSTNRVGRVSFRNPLFGRFPQWEPESIPAVKMAGDLEVRLDDFAIQDGRATVSLAKGPRRPANQRAGNGQTAFTSFQITINPPSGTAEAWQLHRAELDDATGNVIGLSAFSPPGGSIGDSRPDRRGGKTTFTYSIRGTLWPDEAAWRLKLEVKHNVGLDPAEVVTFKNIPVPAAGTNSSFHLANTVGGVQVVLTGFERQPHMLRLNDTTAHLSNDVLIELHGNVAGTAVDLLDTTADDGNSVYSGNLFGSGSAYALDLMNLPTNATSLDIRLVVQKTRTVEFYVKPPGGGTN